MKLAAIFVEVSDEEYDAWQDNILAHLAEDSPITGNLAINAKPIPEDGEGTTWENVQRFIEDGMNTLFTVDWPDPDDDSDEADDARSQVMVDAGAAVELALRRLYELNDGDEAAVGEQLYEIDKAARGSYWESVHPTDPATR